VSVPKCSDVSRLRSLRSPLRGLDTSCALRCVGRYPSGGRLSSRRQDGIRVPMRGRRRHPSATEHCTRARRRSRLPGRMLRAGPAVDRRAAVNWKTERKPPMMRATVSSLEVPGDDRPAHRSVDSV
jgi:hypothetical protein